MQRQHQNLSDLKMRRAELRAQGRDADMIPVQKAIVEASVGTCDEDGAHNYLSTLYLWVGRYAEAEAHARKALDLYNASKPFNAEHIACYEHVLALTIAAQGRYVEAAPLAGSSVRHYAVFHDPPDDFLKRIISQAMEIAHRADLGLIDPELSPVEGHRNLFVFFKPDSN